MAIGGVVFSIFSLIYNEYYIYYGFFTVAFGILGHAAVLFFDWYFHIDQDHKYVDQKYYWIAHTIYFVLFAVWMFLVSRFYLIF